MRVILKQPKHNTPHQCGKQWEGISLGLGDVALFHSQSRQSKEDSGQQVHIYLAVYVVIFSKHKPASDTRSEEGMRLELLPLYVLLNCLQTFIREHKAGQVPGVGVSGLSYRSKLPSQASAFEQKRHDKGMRSTNFSTIYSSIPEAFNNSQCSFIFVLLEEIVDCV